MDKLKMHTPDIAEENYKKLAALFPDAITETRDEDGNIVRAIDKDVLMQEINTKVIDDRQERYQFTWPDKRKSMVMANAPIAKTLRFEKEKSVGRDGTPGGVDSENIYIEGDNLDALKLLQETYLGKVKMIYIDPPYNTGNDFIYEDDFAQDASEYADNSGQTDEEGNRLVQNSESNGRFHTDWLNMIYPRLRIARDFLADDGVIFISIDDNESANLKEICDEIFGAQNFQSSIAWRRRTNQPNDKSKMIAKVSETILCYSKNNIKLSSTKAFHGVPLNLKRKNEYRNPDNDPHGSWSTNPWKAAAGRGGTRYSITTPSGITYEEIWYGSEKTFNQLQKEGRVYWTDNGRGYPRIKIYLNDAMAEGQAAINWFSCDTYGSNQEGSKELEELFERKRIFDNPKPTRLIEALEHIASDRDSIILDFFSGSATTAHALMNFNSKDKGNRKFILVQLPEQTSENSVAYEAGYKTICDIGEERIRRAGKKIKKETDSDIDYGFRCFKVDSSNMKDVYYAPADVEQLSLDGFVDNIKEDRTPEDLLIQVMLDLGILLSSDIETEDIAGKKIFSVADGYLLACFDKDVTEETVIEIAKKKPFYAVFRDNSMANDSVAANFEQIFETYSPETVRKVL